MTISSRSTRPVCQTKDIAAENKTRDFGVTSIGVDHTGARIWALSRDSRLYSYSLDHPDNDSLEIYSHPKLSVDSFYVKMSAMPQLSEQGESKHTLAGNYIACGSSNSAVVLFPSSRSAGVSGNSPLYMDKISAKPKGNDNIDVSPIESTPLNRIGTALLNGHQKEVTGVAWSRDGDLVSIGDDKLACIWRESRNVELDKRTDFAGSDFNSNVAFAES